MISELALMQLVFTQLKMRLTSGLQDTIPVEIAESTAESLRQLSFAWIITIPRWSTDVHQTTSIHSTDVMTASIITPPKSSATAGELTSELKTRQNQFARDSVACHASTFTTHLTLLILMVTEQLAEKSSRELFKAEDSTCLKRKSMSLLRS